MRRLRSALLIVAIGALVALAIWWRQRPQDIPVLDIPPVNSKGIIAALMEKDGVERVVAISPDGTIREAPGTETTEDREISWKPDGKRIVFVSNRSSDGSLQVFEWKPDRDNEPFQLTPTGASRRNPVFASDNSEIYFVSRGNVYALTYPKRQIRPVMPPSMDKETGSEEGEHIHAEGEEHNAIAEAWRQLAESMDGEAFLNGIVAAGKRYFVGTYAIARGQALVMQDLNAVDDHDAAASVPVAGDEIRISVVRNQPIAIVGVTNFRYPILSAVPKDRIQADGTVKRDFVHAVFIANLETRQSTPLFFSPNGEQLMDYATVSPDGTEVALVYCSRVNGVMKPIELLIAPAERAGVGNARAVAKGEISDPTWSADGETLAFVRGNDIWTVRRDGSQEMNLTKGKGRFRSPLFSPMR